MGCYNWHLAHTKKKREMNDDLQVARWSSTVLEISWSIHLPHWFVKYSRLNLYKHGHRIQSVSPLAVGSAFSQSDAGITSTKTATESKGYWTNCVWLFVFMIVWNMAGLIGVKHHRIDRSADVEFGWMVRLIIGLRNVVWSESLIWMIVSSVTRILVGIHLIATELIKT